jgi:ribosomal protein L34E
LATWEKVQRLLRQNAKTAGSFLRNKHGALLKGLLRCKACDAAMVQMVSRKGPKLHRYYVCTRAQKRGYDQCPTGTILAGALERQVCDHLQQLAKNALGPSGCDPNGRLPAVPDPEAGTQEGSPSETGDVARFLAADWNDLPSLEQARVIRFIIESVQYDAREERATVRLTPEAAARLTQDPEAKPGMGEDHTGDREAIGQVEFTVSGLKPTHRRRRPPSHPTPGSVAPAVRTLVLAYQIEQAVREGRARDYADVAKQLGMTRARVSQIMRLLRLPPAVLETLLLTDQTYGPRLSERQLRPMVATSGPLSGPQEFERLISRVERKE